MHNGILLRKRLMKILLTRLENAKIRYYKNLKIFISYAPDEKAKKMINKLKQEKNNIDPKILKHNKTGLRKLYHNLALVLHPDKGGDKKDSINLHKATTAYKEYNLGKLVDIAEKTTRNQAKNSTKHNPVKNSTKHNPVKNSPKNNPVKNINKIRDLTMLKPRDFPLYDHNLKKITEKIKYLISSELFAFGLLDKTTQKKIAEDFWSKY